MSATAARPAAPLVEARGLSVVKGGRTVLDVGELRVGRGEILALLGANGAGKTTLIAALALLERPARGELLLGGAPVDQRRDLTAARRRMAVVFQRPVLFDADVFDNVAIGLRFRGTGRAETARRVAAELERFGIGGLARRRARGLSGGETARVNLARAFALAPELMLLDEPFSALDPATRRSLVGLLARDLRRSGTAAVFSTHDPWEAAAVADRVAVLRAGRIVQAGAPDEVMRRPADAETAALFGDATILACAVESAGEGTFLARAGGARVEAAGEAAPGDRVVLCIRPEIVTLETRDGGGPPTSARNRFRGTVARVTRKEHVFVVEVDCGFPLAACVTQHAVEELAVAPGLAVTASFKATAVHVMSRTTGK